MENAQNLINWVEVSRLLANNDTSISKKRFPKKYTAKVESLINTVNNWIDENVVEDDTKYLDWSILENELQKEAS